MLFLLDEITPNKSTREQLLDLRAFAPLAVVVVLLASSSNASKNSIVFYLQDHFNVYILNLLDDLQYTSLMFNFQC
jgi:homoserine trans-succinylase